MIAFNVAAGKVSFSAITVHMMYVDVTKNKMAIKYAYIYIYLPNYTIST